MSDMTKAEILEALVDVDRKRLEAFSSGVGKGFSTKERLTLISDSTTHEDIDLLHAARRTLSPEDMFILDLYCDVWREWGEYRCAVCGLTPKQAAAENYDCAVEC